MRREPGRRHVGFTPAGRPPGPWGNHSPSGKVARRGPPRAGAILIAVGRLGLPDLHDVVRYSEPTWISITSCGIW